MPLKRHHIHVINHYIHIHTIYYMCFDLLCGHHTIVSPHARFCSQCLNILTVSWMRYFLSLTVYILHLMSVFTCLYLMSRPHHEHRALYYCCSAQRATCFKKAIFTSYTHGTGWTIWFNQSDIWPDRGHYLSKTTARAHALLQYST